METETDDLIAPGDWDVVHRHVADNSRLSLRACGRVDNVLSVDDMTRLLATNAVSPDKLLLVRDGLRLPKALYCDPASGAPLPATVDQLRRQGVSVVISHIHRWMPEVERAARSLGRGFGKRVSANAYLTDDRQSAFPAHFDGHDVLVLQIQGAKRWSCYGPTAQPIIAKGAGEDVRAREPGWQGTLRAGDMLYLPRGEVHRAEPVESPSLHVSFGLSTRPFEA